MYIFFLDRSVLLTLIPKCLELVPRGVITPVGPDKEDPPLPKRPEEVQPANERVEPTWFSAKGASPFLVSISSASEVLRDSPDASKLFGIGVRCGTDFSWVSQYTDNTFRLIFG